MDEEEVMNEDVEVNDVELEMRFYDNILIRLYSFDFHSKLGFK